MTYVPNSKITRGKSLGELAYKTTKKPYFGPYLQTSQGKYYVGSNPRNFGPELVFNLENIDNLLTEFPGLGVKRFSNQPKSKKFNRNSPKIYKKIRNTISIASTKPQPKEMDYVRGNFLRFFAKRINGNSCIEISAETYNKLLSKDPLYDCDLYDIGSIRWFITGNNVHQQNSISIKQHLDKFPYLFQTFPILNEYLQASPTVQENLYTSGGELYYGDGREYVGEYHVHPVQGPMEGAVHQNTPHDKLYYFNQLPQYQNLPYEEFLATYGKIECFKCIFRGGNDFVISNSRSRLLGCPEDTYTTYNEAADHCPSNMANEYVDNVYNRPIDSPGTILETVNPNTNNLDYSNFRPITLGGNSNTVILNDAVSFSDETDDSENNFEGNGTWGFGGTGGGSAGGSNGGYGGGSGGGSNPFGSGGGSCFVPNTLITMADGTKKPISEIKIGDKVKSEKGESNVLDIQIHEGEYKVYSINNNEPFVTVEHPFKTIDGWKAINPINTLEQHQVKSTTLDINDILIKLNNKEVIQNIKASSTIHPKVYNLSLDNEHVFYANEYLVHNEKNVSIDRFGSNVGGGTLTGITGGGSGGGGY